jgi:hypothetical protein
MATWIVAGSTTDLTELPSTTLQNFIIANWTETNPAAAAIKFGQDWWDGFTSYQIHFRRSDVPIVPASIGWKYRAYDDFVMIHVFVKRNVAQEPVQRHNILRELQRIISQKKDQLTLAGTTKNSYMEIVQMNDDIFSSAVASIWHSILRVRIHYWKVDTS